MNVSKRPLLIGLGVLIPVLVVLGVITKWSGLVAAALFVVIAAMVAVAIFVSDPPPPPPILPPPPPPPAPAPSPVPQYRQVTVNAVELPSALPDYDFRFSAVVFWRELSTQHRNPMGLAVELIVSRARAIVAVQSPTNRSLAEAMLTSLLGQLARDPGGQVEAWAVEVTLNLTPDDAQRLEKLATIRKNEAVWEHERKFERSRRMYLGEEVLKSTGSAVVWWLSRQDNEIEAAVKLIGHLARLSATAQDTEVPELFRHLDPIPAPVTIDGEAPVRPETAADHVGALIDKLGYGAADKEDERTLLATLLADAIEKAERPDVAEAVRHRFGDPFPANGHGSADPDDSDPMPGNAWFGDGDVAEPTIDFRPAQPED
jgi:hypothetical protein